MKKTMKKTAFTLVEILAVAAIIGILFVLLAPNVNHVGNRARETGVETDFKAFKMAIEQALDEVPYNVNTDDMVQAMNMYLDNEMKFEKVSGKWECKKKDPWNGKYYFEDWMCPDQSGFNIHSYGADGILFSKNLLGKTHETIWEELTFFDGYDEIAKSNMTLEDLCDCFLLNASDLIGDDYYIVVEQLPMFIYKGDSEIYPLTYSLGLKSNIKNPDRRFK